MTDRTVTARSPARRLPLGRGPLSEFVLGRLRWSPHSIDSPPAGTGDALIDDDLHLALYVCYELHYRGLAGVDDAWEWEPSLLAFRRTLEDRFVAALIDDVGSPELIDPAQVELGLESILTGGTSPSLSAYMAETGTVDEFREFAVHRSAYQLKEADPHTWCIPRLSGGPKAALVLIQNDEYGAGDSTAAHAEMFAVTMDELGLDPSYGSFLDWIPGVTLATVNLASLFGLHRRWRGALVGHLAIFEMASVTPMSRYSAALRRHGFGSPAVDFYDVHVVADEVHQVVAQRDLAGGFAHQQPDLAGDVLFGARALMAVEGRFARHLMLSWASKRTSLLRSLRPTGTAPAVAGVR